MKHAVISILSVFLFAPVCLAKDCKDPKSLYSYFFINGVGNTPETIKDSLIQLKRQLELGKQVVKLTNPQNIEEGDELTGWVLRGVPGFTYGEIQETLDQKKKELEVNGEIVDKETIGLLFKTLNQSKYNIIFSHSQGNLYANDLCRYNAGRKNQINIQVASPASVLECGDSYITLNQDMVINALRVATFPDFTRSVPLPGNVNVGFDFCSDIVCHGLNEVYLGHENTRKIIKQFVDTVVANIKKDELDFNFITISLKEMTQKDKNWFLSSYEYASEVKSNTSLKIRRTIASFKVVSYVADLSNSSFITSLINLNVKTLNLKKWNELLDIPITVESDTEYADVLGVVLDAIKPYCANYSRYMPEKIQGYCRYSKQYFYYTPSQFADAKNFKTFALTSKGLNWDKQKQILTMNCMDVVEETDQVINLSYTPEVGKIITVSINDFNYDIYPRNPKSKPIENTPIIDLSIRHNWKQETYESKFIQLGNRVNFVPTDPESKNFLRCNSINKLFHNNCRDYFLTLLSQTK